ncbi:hypothetical protein FHS36_004580 [Streptomyces eurocidicus]|uniref:Uncharacterized protein n=1 Tax=Streptomyces eurocidicus TaxID=66423 RepID=A0A7W8F2V9_STREU|nr:hypothetical protein [Streptomyces eurocidicus]
MQQALEGGQQGLGEVGEGADEGAGGDGAVEQPGRRGQQEDDGQLSRDGQGHDAQDGPAGEGGGGAALGVDEGSRLGPDPAFGTAGRDVAQPGGGLAERAGEGLVGGEEGLLAAGEGPQGGQEQTEAERERRQHDGQEGGGQQEQARQGAGRREDEGPRDHHEPGGGVPGDLHLVGQPGDGGAVGVPQGGGDDAPHEPVAQRLHEPGDAAVRAPGPVRPGDHGDGGHPEPPGADPGPPGEEPGVQRLGQCVPEAEGVRGLDRGPHCEPPDDAPPATQEPQPFARDAAVATASATTALTHGDLLGVWAGTAVGWSRRPVRGWTAGEALRPGPRRVAGVGRRAAGAGRAGVPAAVGAGCPGDSRRASRGTEERPVLRVAP